MRRAKLGIIGECLHGPSRSYLKLINKVEYSFQLGNFVHYNVLNKVDPNRHKLLTGNHDDCFTNGNNYFRNYYNFLDDYNVWDFDGIGSVFCVRGGPSPYKKLSYENKISEVISQHELSESSMLKAIELYEKTKPQLMLTHECPSSIAKYVESPPYYYNRTRNGLQVMLEKHIPNMWVFGRYSQFWREEINGCKFIQLNKVPDKGCFLKVNPAVYEVV